MRQFYSDVKNLDLFLWNRGSSHFLFKWRNKTLNRNYSYLLFAIFLVCSSSNAFMCETALQALDEPSGFPSQIAELDVRIANAKQAHQNELDLLDRVTDRGTSIKPSFMDPVCFGLPCLAVSRMSLQTRDYFKHRALAKRLAIRAGKLSRELSKMEYDRNQKHVEATIHWLKHGGKHFQHILFKELVNKLKEVRELTESAFNRSYILNNDGDLDVLVVHNLTIGIPKWMDETKQADRLMKETRDTLSTIIQSLDTGTNSRKTFVAILSDLDTQLLKPNLVYGNHGVFDKVSSGRHEASILRLKRAMAILEALIPAE